MANRTSRERAARQRAQIAVRRRSHQSRSPEAAEPEPPRRGRGWLIAILVTTAALAAIVVVALVVGGGDGPEQPESALLTATPVEGASGALGITAPPADYAVTYELVTADDTANVADTAPPPSSRTYSTATEAFKVRRPFDTHIENLDGSPPGGDVQQTIISDFGHSATMTAGDEQQVETILPGAGIGDWRLDAILDDVVEDGTFQFVSDANCSAGSARCTAPVRRWRTTS